MKFKFLLNVKLLVTLCAMAFWSNIVFGQLPCGGGAFLGTDPCSAEPLTLGSNCAASAEEFRTNGCSGTNTTTSTCGLNAGANIVWGRFSVGAAGNVTVTWTASNNRNIRFGIYQFANACSVPSVGETEITCVNNGGNGVDETTTIFLNPGTYYICGESTGNLSAASQICVHTPTPQPTPVTASDCNVAVNVCTDLSFAIDPNGQGAITNEIPALGAVGNPDYSQFNAPPTSNPWGTTNEGCLRINESNSTWMLVNISGSGSLEFTFGGNGAQFGFYDWIMYPANVGCAAPMATAPVRCNWNGVQGGGTGLASTLPLGGDATNFEPPLAVTAGEVYLICFSNYSAVESHVPLQFGGTAVVSCSPLPVELLSFSATLLENHAVRTAWATLSEKGSDYFDVERSIDGVTFEKIGRVTAAGNSTELIEYSFIDEDPIRGKINYYRLKQVDLDGEFEYMEVNAVSVPQGTNVEIYPNPSQGKVVLEIGQAHGKEANVLVSDLTGAIMTDLRKKIQNGKIVLDLSSLEKGSYLIKIQTAKGAYFCERLVLE